MSKVLLILPIGTDDKSILLDCLSAWHGAISGANGIDLITYPVSYSDITDEEIDEVIKCIKNENALIGVIVYGDIPSSICLTKFHEKKSRNLPVITVANVSPYPKGVDFAFRMWFDIASLCQSVRRMVDHAAIDDKLLCLVYNATDYGETIKKSLEDRFEFGKSVSYGDSGVNGQLKSDEVSKFSGVILIGFGSGYDKSLLELDEIYNRVGITGIVFTDNYITDKHLACKHLRICGLAVDQIVPDLELNKLEGWLKSDCELHNSIQTSLSVKNKFSEIISNSCQGELDQGFSSVEPPIYFATKDAVSFFARLSASGLDQESVLAKFRKKQFRQMTLGSAIIQPLGETKIDLNYKWIGQIPANFLKESLEYSTHEAISMVFNSVENILDNWSPCKKFPYDLFLSICKILSENLNITSVVIENLPNDETSVYNELALDDLKRFKAFSLIFPFFERCIPIQFNGGKRILADNDALNVYLVIDADDVRSINSDGLIVDGKVSSSIGIIMAKNRHTAEYLWEYKNLPDSVDKTLTEIREEGGLVFLPETISDFNPQSKFVIRNNDLFVTLKETCIQIQRENRSFTYIVSEIGTSENSQKPLIYVLLMAKRKLSCLELSALKSIVGRLFALAHISESWYANEISNTKSAIGSIMSRNGSHNIGSHVLAALSHNVGTMPDDRVLYQYIQHRMDYIATATTDFPVWKQPLYLVGNLMKTFLMQRHLLDYITGSEGLRAYQFQNDRIDTTTTGCQPNTIRIHVRRINDADSDWCEANNFSTTQTTVNFIGYPDSPCDAGAMKHDIELAIPGGIIGQHAFFTILENILRNAAKHEWSKLKIDKKGYLDVHIDFKDDPDSGVVEFVVWTDSEYSRQNYKVGTFKNRAVRLTREDVLARLSQDDSSGELDTNGLEEHQKLQLMMARSLINNEGQLRKENWGLAEMRISAGFLNVVDIATIGGLGDRTATMDLISPTMVLYKDHYCMGYHFHVPKPRELLIVVPDDLLKNKKNAIQKTDLESAHAKLMKYGVGIVTEDEVGKESEKPERSDRLSYAYALFNKFDRDCMRTWKIPFRLVTIANDPLSPPLSPKKGKGQKPIDRRADYTGNADFFAPNSFSAWLRDVLESDDTTKEHAEKILSEIYASWVRHLKKECFGVGNGLKNIPIAIDLDGDNKNAEGSLISDMELLELVLGDCFNSAVDSYLTSPLSEKADYSLKHTLKLLKTLHPRIIELQRLKTKTLIDTEKNKEIKDARDVDGVIRAQLLTWCIALKEDANVRKIASDLYYIEEDYIEEGRNQTCTPGLKGFMLFLTNTILNQVKALMTRYEERFVPLPRDILPPKHQTSQRSENRDPNSQHGGNGCLEPLIDLGNQQVFETVSDEVKCNFLEEHMNASNDTAEILAFWRHEVSASPRTIERGKKEIKLRYREPLSGSQSYLNSFETFYDGSSTEIQRKRFVAKLLETGLTKVLLIDERVKRFENEHSNVKATFADIGISTLDNECCETKELFNFAQQERHPIDVKIDDQLISEFDIVVIHQGVIDKLLADHNNPDKIRKFIEYLKSEIRYVVVTTGRGNPANIPNDVRVLPFSVIESTLFKKYPEKLIFIDAIMNLLPSGGKE